MEQKELKPMPWDSQLEGVRRPRLLLRVSGLLSFQSRSEIVSLFARAIDESGCPGGRLRLCAECLLSLFTALSLSAFVILSLSVFCVLVR